LLPLVVNVPALSAQGSLSLSDENIVRRDERSARFCPVSDDGGPCEMTHSEALEYCKEQGARLASTRDFARFMNADAILEVDQIVDGKIPEGYYEVACVDIHGQKDVFYFNNAEGRTGQRPRKLSGDLAKLSFWTSSLVLGKTDYAHVFYGPLGGGGGTPEDHLVSRRHNVVMIKE
jgi:hypothetical protein